MTARKGKLANFYLFLAYNELNCQYNKCVFCILQVFHISQKCRRNRPSVWTFNRASEWWDVIPVLQRLSGWRTLECPKKHSSTYATNCVQRWRDRTQTSACVYVPLKKRITIALWKLATGAEYRSVTYVGRNSTVSTGHQGPAKQSVSL